MSANRVSARHVLASSKPPYVVQSITLVYPPESPPQLRRPESWSAMCEVRWPQSAVRRYIFRQLINYSVAALDGIDGAIERPFVLIDMDYVRFAFPVERVEGVLTDHCYGDASPTMPARAEAVAGMAIWNCELRYQTPGLSRFGAP